MVEVTGKMILAIPMRENDAEATNIRGYLVALAEQVWVEGEGFSGKRPFGNSDWHDEVYEALEAFGLPADDNLIRMALAELAHG